MRMFRFLLIFLSLSMCIGLVLAGKKFSDSCFTIDRYLFEFDQSFSSSFKKNITDFVASQLPRTFESADILYHNIHQKFPAIKNLSFHYCAPGVAVVSFDASLPLLIVNDSCVLIAEGDFIDKSWFNPCVFNNLQPITIPSLVGTARASQGLVEASLIFGKKDIYKNYKIEWMDDFYVCLHDQEQKLFSVVCNVATINNDSLLESCNTIKEQLFNGETVNKKNNKNWIADIRFDKQIILF